MLHPPVHRLFFALRPPQGALEYLVDEQWRFGPGHEVRRDHLHMTLAITNDFATYPERQARAMMRIGDAVIARQCPVVLDQAVASHRSVMLTPSETLHAVEELHCLLRTGMLASQVKMRARWRHSAHMTLLYRDGKTFIKPARIISWRATEFVLIHSFAGLNQHETKMCWPLIARAAPTLH